MCGISGIFSKSDNLENILNKFNECLINRGPDNSSIFIEQRNSFGMGHTRLSILDLSNRGNQPMYDHSGDWVISFNGEIYNHLKIRDHLAKKTDKKIRWKSDTDTETILIANQILGFENTLNLLEGMFAFALYNKSQNLLYLARDRIGEKPLYYYHHENKFIFGSDISIFRKVNEINLSINYDIIPEYLEKGYVRSPFSIYKFILKLDPGHYLEIKDNFSFLKKKCYWNIKKLITDNLNSRQSPLKKFTDEKNDLKNILENTVLKQTISDVQIGSFLSGGIDSSLITSILQRNSSNKIKTFTVGFKDKNFDESIQAKKISNYLGTQHHEFFFKDNDITNFVENLENIYSEPFADSSQIPTYLISKLMRKEAKVILSGDGGDEFYGGYNRYLYLNLIKFFSKNIPTKLQRNLNIILKILPNSNIDKYLAFLNIKNFRSKIKKFINFIDTENDNELYERMTSLSSKNNFFLITNNVSKNSFQKKKEFIDDLGTQENFMYFDQVDYLPNDVLCKVDRATMHNSIESRAPFLDHKLIEKSWQIPLSYKIKGSNGKMILKEILKDYLPDRLILKSKAGFAIPIDDLLRTTLKPWAEEIFQNPNNNNIINYDNVKLIWNQHKKNKVNEGGVLWAILILQNWLNKQHR